MINCLKNELTRYLDTNQTIDISLVAANAGEVQRLHMIHVLHPVVHGRSVPNK